MPYVTTWVDPKVAIELNGVTIYHSYSEDDIESPYTYWFTLNKDGRDGDEHEFDVREFDIYNDNITPIENLEVFIKDYYIVNCGYKLKVDDNYYCIES